MNATANTARKGIASYTGPGKLVGVVDTLLNISPRSPIDAKGEILQVQQVLLLRRRGAAHDQQPFIAVLDEFPDREAVGLAFPTGYRSTSGAPRST